MSRFSESIGALFIGGRFKVREIIDLAAAEDMDAPEDDLRMVFEWYHQRSVAGTRGALAGALAVVAAFLAAFVTEDAAVSLFEGALGAAAVVALLLLAIVQNQELAHLHHEYLASLRLLGELRTLKPALQKHPHLKRASRGD